MIPIAKFTGDWHCINKEGEKIVIPNIEREVWYNEDTTEDEIYLHPSMSKKIDNFLYGTNKGKN